MEFIKNTGPGDILLFWKAQLRRLRKLAAAADPTQAAWGDLIPDFIRPAAGRLKTVKISHLMRQFGLGGQSWIKQFIYGFEIVGAFSQDGLLPVGPKVKPPLPTESIWGVATGDSGPEQPLPDTNTRANYGLRQWANARRDGYPLRPS